MLMLSRLIGEEIVIADEIRVRIVAIRGKRVQLGISAPDRISIHRDEVYRRRRQFASTPSEMIPADSHDANEDATLQCANVVAGSQTLFIEGSI
jgi:carbon storage regulator